MGERDVLSGGPAWNPWHPSPEEEPLYRVCGQRASELETHGTTWNVTTITLLIWDPDPAVGGQNNDLFSLQEQEFRIWLGWGRRAEWAVDGDEGAACLPGRLAGPAAADSGGFLLHCSYVTSKCPWGCVVRFC